MKKITTLILFFATTLVFSQVEIDMTKELSNINGHITIDGNTLQAKLGTKDQIIITGKNMVFNDRSSFVFNNVIIRLTGNIIVRGALRPTLMDSYILCKNAGSLKSKNIIETKVVERNEVEIGKVAYIKNLQGNPEIWLYSTTGQRIFKGSKSEANSFKVPVSRYDVKVVGQSFKDKVFFYN